jgi:hypothetical protein
MNEQEPIIRGAAWLMSYRQARSSRPLPKGSEFAPLTPR